MSEVLLFYFIIPAVILQRLIEVTIAKRNEKWLLNRGAIEYGHNHYKFIILMHTLFFISLIVEFNVAGKYYELNIFNYLFLVFFLLLEAMRFWVIHSLGKYWNTKIFRIPNSELVSTGLYKYFRHPNYIIVTCEIFTLPMIFNLYYTAVIFSLLNAIILSIRVGVENKALKN